MMRMPPSSAERTRDIVHQIAKQCDVVPDRIEDAYPCTKFQADSFKAATQVAGIVQYNLIFRLEDATPHAVDRICEVFEGVNRRNPALRSRIVRYEYAGMLRIAQAIIKEDLKWLKFDDLDQYCHERIGRRLRYGDRLVQYAISRDRKFMVWTLHHATYDGWSLGLLWKELCETISDGGVQAALIQRPKHVKLIARLQKPVNEIDKRYWIEHLANYKGPQLKHYKLAPDSDNFRNGSLELVDIRTSSINITARVQTAWFCTLAELYGNLDVMTMIIATGRNTQVEGVTEMRGSCMCLVPFRKRIDLMAPLYQVMMEVEKSSGELLAHEHAGMELLETLVEEAQRPAHIFNLKSRLSEDFTGFRGLEFRYAHGFKKMTDWLFAVSIGEKAMRWDLYFDSNRFDQDAVNLICERFPVLVEVCQRVESHETVTLEDIIDVNRLS